MTTVNWYELSRYLVAGSFAFLSDFAVYIYINKIHGLHYLVANLAGFSVGIFVSFIFCVRWVFFKRTYGKVAIEFPVFLLISLVTLLGGEFFLLVLVELVALTPIAAKVIMTCMIFMANFIMKKYILFR
jgi:putative flippase GtrA